MFPKMAQKCIKSYSKKYRSHDIHVLYRIRPGYLISRPRIPSLPWIKINAKQFLAGSRILHFIAVSSSTRKTLPYYLNPSPKTNKKQGISTRFRFQIHRQQFTFLTGQRKVVILDIQWAHFCYIFCNLRMLKLTAQKEKVSQSQQQQPSSKISFIKK